MHELNILSQVNRKVSLAQFKQKGLCMEGSG